MTTPRKTIKKSILTITKHLRARADYEFDAWDNGRYFNMQEVSPPDITLILDQLDAATDCAKGLKLSMSLLLQIAYTLQASEDANQKAIGTVLISLHTEINALNKSLTTLPMAQVDYPVPTKVRDEDSGI